jgi:hypothetical protein
MLNYLSQSKGEIDISTIEEIAGKIRNNNLKSNVMTWAESLRREAHTEGLEKGLSEGLQKGKLIGQIVYLREFLGLSPLNDKLLASKSLQKLEEMALKLRSQAARQTR